MKVLKNGLLLRLIILSLSLVIITAALFIEQNRPPGKVAGTVTNPILVDNKFCDNPANAQQAACTNFISNVLAASPNPATYQDVAGDVGVSGNVGIRSGKGLQLYNSANNAWSTINFDTDPIDGTNKFNVEGGYLGIKSGNGIRLYNPANNSWSSINFDGGHTNFTWHLRVTGEINSEQNGTGAANWNAGALNLLDTGNRKIWQILNRGEAENNGAEHNKLQVNFFSPNPSPSPGGTWYHRMVLDTAGNMTISGCLNYNGGTSGTCSSDIKVKKNINPFNLGLQEIIGLIPVTYQFNGLGDTTDDGKIKTGLIAQNVEKTAPQLVNTEQIKLHPNDATTTEIKAVDYSALTFILINAVKTQQKEIEALQKEVEELKKK